MTFNVVILLMSSETLCQNKFRCYQTVRTLSLLHFMILLVMRILTRTYQTMRRQTLLLRNSNFVFNQLVMIAYLKTVTEICIQINKYSVILSDNDIYSVLLMILENEFLMISSDNQVSLMLAND